MSIDIMAFVAPRAAECMIMVPLLFLVIFPIVFLLPVIAFWRICSKAGLPGALGLLMLVPIANIILPLYVAFAEWPAMRGDGQS